jgi:TonB family protein
MMSATANSLQKPEGFDVYVKKFRVICVMHDVQIGSHADLPGFMQKLVEDRHLAMDFWGFVGKLSNREGGDLSDDQMLAVVVEGVTRGEISQEDGELSQTVDDLRAMLAGVDVQGPGQSLVELAPFPPIENGSQQRDEDWRAHAVEPSSSPSGSRAAFTPEMIDGEAGNSTASPPTLHRQADEALQWREPAKASDTSAESATRPVSKERLVLKPVEPPVADSLAAKSGSLPAHVPLEGYSQPEGYGKAISSMLLVLVLAGAGFGVYRYRTLLRNGFEALIQKIQSKNTAPPANQSAPPIPASAEETPTDQAKQEQPPTAPPILQGISTPPPPITSTTVKPNQTASAGVRAAKGAIDSSSGRKAVPSIQTPADGITSSELAGAVRVDPSAMESRLVVSRVPAYPDIAKKERIQGQVVMQVIVSKDGTVKHLHVIQGDSRLRSSAVEAVYKRRYRPYLLSGQPVDVTTTITVDFNLNR